METIEIVAMGIWLGVWVLMVAIPLSEVPEKREDDIVVMSLMIGWLWPAPVVACILISPLCAAIFGLAWIICKLRARASCQNQS